MASGFCLANSKIRKYVFSPHQWGVNVLRCLQPWGSHTAHKANPSVRLSAPAQLLSDRKGGGVTEKHFRLAVKGPAVELRGQLECLACFKLSEVVF